MANIESHALPVIGEIAAGGPIEAYQDASETLTVPDAVAPSGDAYVLRVRGDSMVDAHITDGDFVVIRPQQTARDGDIVVAQVEENAVTLKRFFKEKNRVRLQPANEQYAPQFYDVGAHPGQADRGHPPGRLIGPSTDLSTQSTAAGENRGRNSSTSPLPAAPCVSRPFVATTLSRHLLE